QRLILTVGTAQERRLDVSIRALHAVDALASLIVEGEQTLPAQQLAVHTGELVKHSGLLHGRRVGFAEPEPVRNETRQRRTEASRKTAVILTFQKVYVEEEVCRRQDRMPEDGVELLMPDLRGAESVFIVTPPGIRRGEVRETQVMLSVLERHLQDSRLLRSAQVANAP